MCVCACVRARTRLVRVCASLQLHSKQCSLLFFRVVPTKLSIKTYRYSFTCCFHGLQDWPLTLSENID
jgi:hypothetical protein